jgi:hypothetical protein
VLRFKNQSGLSRALAGTTRFLLALVVFLTPLLFLPGLNDPVELPKGVVWVVLVAAAALTFVLSWVRRDEVRLRPVPGQWWLLGLALVLILSTVFSTNRVTSLLGGAGYVHHTLPVLLSFIVFVWLAVQVFDPDRDVPMLLSIALAAIGLLQAEPQRVARLRDRSRLFLKLAKDAGLNTGNSHDTPVIPVILGDSLRCVRVASALLRQGIDVQPILYPAVPESQSRLRFFVTAEHSEEQLRRTVQSLTDCLAVPPQG